MMMAVEWIQDIVSGCDDQVSTNFWLYSVINKNGIQVLGFIAKVICSNSTVYTETGR